MKDIENVVTLDTLLEHGLTPGDVARRCPGATRFTDDGLPYWRTEDVGPLFEADDEQGRLELLLARWDRKAGASRQPDPRPGRIPRHDGDAGRRPAEPGAW